MELIINHQKKTYTEPSLTLEALLLLEAPSGLKGVAVALNNHVVPKNLWASTLLQNSDNILIISATQGG
ncbi:sulfur carrier protein ThiS [Elizabethkingia sp. JS20170427COW]|uniref:sulfur carrier protein ThiS n=1 Tax=Elizabethkingia sp. JS20170427COW TaxID=2583851 RepID=UPI0011104ACA|nr:sulfur carrier protein ThiS [Elizabethkingia sp. JS20170427COW]QCX54025.1 sulfur carrier protein ThiS [Elizabethkingia sp. JS20170427COW]